MTAATPDADLRALSRTTKPRKPGLLPRVGEEGDRVFVTLLSLNFMLLAFFVVLGTTASVDAPRAASVTKSLQLVFAEPKSDAGEGTKVSLTARQAFQAGVSDAVASLLPPSGHVSISNKDRVDLSVSGETLRAAGSDAPDAIAKLLRAAPAGLRYEMIIDGGAGDDAIRMAEELIARDVPATALMVGPNSADGADLRFAFLLLDNDADTVATLAAGGRP